MLAPPQLLKAHALETGTLLISGKTLDKQGFLEALSNDQTQNEMQTEFDMPLHKGVIATKPEKDYTIPPPRCSAGWLSITAVMTGPVTT